MRAGGGSTMHTRMSVGWERMGSDVRRIPADGSRKNQVTGMTAAGGQNETQWADPPPPLNLIPPTPLKDIDDMAPHGTLGATTPSNAHAREWFPEENLNLIDRESSLQEQSLTGRRSSETNDKLEEGFALIDRLFNDLSKSTMMPTNQVINIYLKSRGQEVHSINYWNIYANYFKEYKERELARLTTGGSENDKGTAMQRLCYEKFKEAFPDNYQDILSAYSEAHHIGAASTLNQHLQSFQKLHRQVASLIWHLVLDSASTRFGFESAMVLCGNIVNQDASLGHVHTTPAAAGFFEMRCRANNDTIIGHLKAHVFNETSLSVVKDAFKDSEIKMTYVMMTPLRINLAGVERIHFKWAQAGTQLTSATLDNLDGKFASFKTFHGSQCPSVLTNENLCIKGYPAHKCLLPGEYHNFNSKSKVIGGLTQKEVLILVEALKAGTMYVAKVPKTSRAALITSEFPIITGKAPPSDYFHSGARWMFANHHTDYNGPSRMKISTATTKVKKTGDTHKLLSNRNRSLIQLNIHVIPQPLPAAAIEFPTSESNTEPHKIIPEMEFEDAAHGKKRKVAASRLP
ncbi:hypothetical protein DFH29DRAFT_879987 [Suillus ampliporus]|nr:hypothetical protein DFH29DRAFT_879987 [Suillus ampliporus]